MINLLTKINISTLKKTFSPLLERKHTFLSIFQSRFISFLKKKRKEKFGLYIIFHIMSFSAFKNTLYYDISNIERCILNDFNSCNNTLLHSMIWTAHTYAHIHTQAHTHTHTHTHNKNNRVNSYVLVLLCEGFFLCIYYKNHQNNTKQCNEKHNKIIIKWMKKYQMFILKSTLWAHK